MASKLRQLTQALLPGLHPGTRKRLGVNYLNNHVTCQEIITRLEPKLEIYKSADNKLDIVDLSPGNGVWSANLYNALLPTNHLLVESNEGHCHYLQRELIEKNMNAGVDNSFQLFNEDVARWKTFDSLIGKGKFVQPTFQRKDSIHTELLLTGSVSDELMFFHWLCCIGYQNWLFKYGKVRLLFWMREQYAQKLLADIGTTKRNRSALFRETFTDASIVAFSNESSAKLYSEQLLESSQPLVFSQSDLVVKRDGHNIALVELVPKFVSLDMYTYEYVIKRLMFRRSSPLTLTIDYLGPGARDFFLPLLTPELQHKCAKDLTPAEGIHIAQLFDQWPFKPSVFDWYDTDDLDRK